MAFTAKTAIIEQPGYARTPPRHDPKARRTLWSKLIAWYRPSTRVVLRRLEPYRSV